MFFSDLMATPNSPIGSKRAQNDPKKANIKKAKIKKESQKTKNLSK